MAEKKKPSLFERLKEHAKNAAKGLVTTPRAEGAPRKFEDTGRDTGDAVRELRKKQEEALKEYRKGGKVKKTGPAKLHKGEHVLTAKQTKKMEKMPMVKKALGVKKAKKKS